MMTGRRPPAEPSWAAYQRRFHTERPGITEQVLQRCHADGRNPYQWCAEPLERIQGVVLDLACGSGPMVDHLAGWIGLDTSTAELGAARDRHRGPLVLASVPQLPCRSASLDGVVCSMGMQIIEPLHAALGEIARVLRTAGSAVLLLPATRPLSRRDALLYGRLQLALRQRIHYPNDRALRRSALPERAARVGLKVTADERQAFKLPLTDHADVEELLVSLYLPTVDPRGLARGRRLLHSQIGSELTVPLRRVILGRGATMYA